jgi:hypothetical protein
LSRRLNAGFELFGHGHGYLATLRALGRRGGGARNGTERILCFAPGTPRHWPRRSQDPKGPISLALGSWRWGGGYGGGEGWGLGVKGGGVAYFLRQTCADIYHTGVFQKYVFCS